MNELHSHDSEVYTPSTSLLQPKDDPEHVAMIPETPSTDIEYRIQNEKNGTMILHAHGERVHTGTIQSPWYIYQEQILAHGRPVKEFIQREKFLCKTGIGA